ncbi:MAG: aldehyde dehydrogenase family protein [Patescibacteria group bacterium]
MDAYIMLQKILQRTDKESGKPIVSSYVGSGLWESSENGVMIPVYNPATGSVIAFINEGKELILNDFILRAAKTAQDYWHFKIGEQDKEQVFRRITWYIDKFRGIFASVIIKEAGKLWKWADAEVQETIDTVWHYHGELSRVHGEYSRCQLSDKTSIVVRDPYGIILAITPWNFPLAVPAWKIFGALAGGNAIIVKDSEQTPLSTSMLIWCIHKALCDVLGTHKSEELRGLVQVIHGTGEFTGKNLLETLDYDKVAFTGGAETGATVAKITGSRLRPCHLELGGHAGMVVMPDFDLDRAVAEAVNACTGDTGQRCVSLRAVFIKESKHDEFVQRYITAIKKIPIGDPSDFMVRMGPLSSKQQFARVEAMVDKTASELNKMPIIGGAGNWAGFNESFATKNNKGYYFPPTVFSRVPWFATNITAMKEEIFGPVLCVVPIPAKPTDEFLASAIDCLNSSQYGLSNSFCTNDISSVMKAIEQVKTGILYINRGTTGAEVGKYFGGVKNSGWGREGRGIEDWTILKQVYIDHHGKPRMAQEGNELKAYETIEDGTVTLSNFLA